jgi:hypothetical protein
MSVSYTMIGCCSRLPVDTVQVPGIEHMLSYHVGASQVERTASGC